MQPEPQEHNQSSRSRGWYTNIQSIATLVERE